MQKSVAAGQSQGSAGSLEVTTPQVVTRTPGAAPAGAPGLEYERVFSREGIDPVSYTHLTLPTIYSV